MCFRRNSLTHKNHFWFAEHRPYSKSKAQHSDSQIICRSSLHAIGFMAEAILPAIFNKKGFLSDLPFRGMFIPIQGIFKRDLLSRNRLIKCLNNFPPPREHGIAC